MSYVSVTRAIGWFSGKSCICRKGKKNIMSLSLSSCPSLSTLCRDSLWKNDGMVHQDCYVASWKRSICIIETKYMHVKECIPFNGVFM